jgi:nucleoside-diphosphate-sugar epimerase
MNILVTGGNGFLGRHLVQSLLERGDRVRVLSVPGEDVSWLEGRGATVYRGDICRPETLSAPVEGVDAVVHLAGMLGIWRPLSEYRAVNVTGTENVCRAALGQRVDRVVHLSSLLVYGMDLGAVVHEDFPLVPLREPYTLTKAQGDQVVQRMITTEGLPAVIIRPGTMFGPADRVNFGRIADRLSAGKGVIIGRGDNALPMVYVTDVVQSLLLALDHERAIGQAFNITNDEPLTQQEFFDATAVEIGANPPRLHIPYRPLYATAFASERLAMMTRARLQPVVTRQGVKLYGTDNRHAIEKARRELGYTPRVSLREGIRLAASWYSHRSPASSTASSV